MRRIIVLCTFISMFSAVYAQVRESVFIVRPEYSKDTVDALKKISASLSSEGYKDFEESIEDMQTGSFGSGFLYIAPDNSRYVITNRHVIAGAETITLEQENRDGSLSSIEANIIIALDDTLDLALVQISEGFSNVPSLTLARTIPADGTDIWSAGYPGLADKPAWQFAKGNITNAVARVEELVDPDRSTLIQHSAPIDPGNSGGPLLIKTPSGSYEVIGINTWKAFRRQAANFAVPVTTISAFLEKKIIKPSEKNSKDALQERIEDFELLLNIEEDTVDAIFKISRYISREYAIQNGLEALLHTLKYAPSTIRSNTVDSLYGSSPVNALQLAAAFHLYDTLESDRDDSEITLTTPLAADNERNLFDTELVTGAGEPVALLSWQEYKQEWFIVPSEKAVEETAAKNEQEKVNKNRTALEIAQPYQFLIYGLYENTGGDSHGFGLGFHYLNNVFVVYGIEASSGNYKYVDYFDNKIESSYTKFSGLGRLQLPLVTDTTMFNPFVEAKLGLQFAEDSDEYNGLLVSYGAGIQAALLREKLKYVLGVQINMDAPTLMTSSASGTGSIKNIVTVSLGIGF